MQVPDPDAEFQQVVGQVLGHLLGQRCDQHAFVLFGALADLPDQVVDLAMRRLHDHLRINQARRPNHLLDELAVGAADLVWPRCRGQIDRLPDPGREFLPGQRPVVQRTGQPEPVFDEGALPRRVTLVHAADLRDRDVRLVDHQQKVGGEVVDQGCRCGAGAAAVDVP